MLDMKNNFSGPHVNLKHKIAVVAPNGEFVSYCGMWYENNTDYALVEPVATDPQYRMARFHGMRFEFLGGIAEYDLDQMVE